MNKNNNVCGDCEFMERFEFDVDEYDNDCGSCPYKSCEIVYVDDDACENFVELKERRR